MKREPDRISGLGSVLPAQSGEKKPRKLSCWPPPPNLTTSRRIPVQAGYRFSLVDRQGCDKQGVRFPLLSPLQSSPYSFRCRRGRLLSTDFMRLPSKRHYADYSSKSKIRSLSTRSSLGRKLNSMPTWTQSDGTPNPASRTRRSTI